MTLQTKQLGSKWRGMEQDDSDDDEVSSQLGVQLGIHEGIGAKKQLRANKARQDKAKARLLNPAAQRNSELLNLRRLNELLYLNERFNQGQEGHCNVDLLRG